MAGPVNLSEPPFPDLLHADNTYYIIGMLLGLNDTMYVKHLAQYLAQNKCSLGSRTLWQKQNMALLLLIATYICPELCQLQSALKHLTLKPFPPKS